MRSRRIKALATTGMAMIFAVGALSPAQAAPPTVSVASTVSHVSPIVNDHDLLWIPWDDTIYSSYATCASRAKYLVYQYTDIVAWRCVVRYTRYVTPQRYGMMLEVQRP